MTMLIDLHGVETRSDLQMCLSLEDNNVYDYRLERTE